MAVFICGLENVSQVLEDDAVLFRSLESTVLTCTEKLSKTAWGNFPEIEPKITWSKNKHKKKKNEKEKDVVAYCKSYKI